MLGLLAAPFSWMWPRMGLGKAELNKQSIQLSKSVLSPGFKYGNGQEVFLKTSGGLERIFWDEIKSGDAIVLMSVLDGRIITIFDMGLTESDPDFTKTQQSCDFWIL